MGARIDRPPTGMPVAQPPTSAKLRADGKTNHKPELVREDVRHVMKGPDEHLPSRHTLEKWRTSHAIPGRMGARARPPVARGLEQAIWVEAHLAADARWIEKRREATDERRRTEELREMASRLQAQVSAGEKRSSVLTQRAQQTQRRWCEAAERWEKHRAALGLPFHDPRMWLRT